MYTRRNVKPDFYSPKLSLGSNKTGWYLLPAGSQPEKIFLNTKETFLSDPVRREKSDFQRKYRVINQISSGWEQTDKSEILSDSVERKIFWAEVWPKLTMLDIKLTWLSWSAKAMLISYLIIVESNSQPWTRSRMRAKTRSVCYQFTLICVTVGNFRIKNSLMLDKVEQSGINRVKWSGVSVK